MVTGIRLAILGPVRAWRGDAELDVGPLQQRAMLALLALHGGEPVSAEELIDALWLDEAPRSARGTVRTYVYKLRGILGKAALESSGSGYALAAGVVSVDLRVFCDLLGQARLLRAEGRLAEAAGCLDRALALWQGRALGGVPDRYADKQCGWLDELRLEALESRFSVAVALGRHAEVIADLTAAVAAHPFRERMRELLMLALYRSGRQADALASYQDLRMLLSRHFPRSFLLRYEDDMREFARAIIAKFLHRGELEFVGDFAVPFSAGSLARQDVLVGAVTGEIDGLPLTNEERRAITTTLFLGASDTTRSMMVNIAYHLAIRDDNEARMKRPDLRRDLLNGFIRSEPTASIVARTVTTDAEFSGTALGLGFVRTLVTAAFEEPLVVATNFRLKPGTDRPRYMGPLLSSPPVLRLEFDRRESAQADQQATGQEARAKPSALPVKRGSRRSGS